MDLEQTRGRMAPGDPGRDRGRPGSDEKPDSHRGRPYPAISAYLKTHPEAAQEVAALVERLESGTAPPEHRALAEESSAA